MILAMGLLAAPARIGRMLRSIGHAIKQHLGDHYRPEQHYMRGPGPKWQERNAAVPVREARQAAGEPAARRADEAQRPGLNKQSRCGRR